MNAQTGQKLAGLLLQLGVAAITAAVIVMSSLENIKGNQKLTDYKVERLQDDINDLEEDFEDHEH